MGNMPKLQENNAVIITGAARRIGRAMAIFLASKHKYDIFAHYNTSHDAALNLQNIIQGTYGRRCILLQSDLRDPSSYEKIITSAFREMPYCNVLINNASQFYEDNLENCTIENFHENFNIHTRAPVFLTQHFAKMCRGKGKVINMIDAKIERYKTKYLSYILSKKSLSDLTKIAAEQLAPNICVNAICPEKIPDHEIDNIHTTDNMSNKPTLQRLLEVLESLLDFRDNTQTGRLMCVTCDTTTEGPLSAE